MILEQNLDSSKVMKQDHKNQNVGTAASSKTVSVNNELLTSLKTNLQCKTCNVSFTKNIQLLNHIGKMHANEPKNPTKKRKIEPKPEEKSGDVKILSEMQKEKEGHVWVKDFSSNTWQLVKPPSNVSTKGNF